MSQSASIAANEGDVIETAAGRFVVKDGVPVPAVKRGTLGGELWRLGDCGHAAMVGWFGRSSDLYGCENLSDLLVETNIPPRLSGERMTAGEAAAIPGIVGRWVAVQINEKSSLETMIGFCDDGWLEGEDKLILLPEGFGE
jgi:hypothetical protein